MRPAGYLGQRFHQPGSDEELTVDRRELRHITVESGGEMISGRAQVDDWAVEQLTPVVKQAVNSGRRTQVLGGYWIQCELKDGGLAVAIGHADAGERILISMNRAACARRRPARPARPHRRAAGAAGIRCRQPTVPART